MKELTPEVRDRLMSKVLGYYEVPAPKGTKKAVLQLGFPTAAWDVNVNVPMLLLSIAGNCHAFPTKMRLLDFYIPEKLAKKFKGPKFGIPGVRKILGVDEAAAHAADHQAQDGHDPGRDGQPGLPERPRRRGPVQGRRDVHGACQLLLREEAGGGAQGPQEGGRQDRAQDPVHGQHHRRGGPGPGEGAQGLRDGRHGPAARVLRRAVGAAGAGGGPEDHRAHPPARVAPAGPAADDQLPGAVEDLPAVRRGHDAHAEHLVQHPRRIDRGVPARLADPAGALLPHQAHLPHARRGDLPGSGAPDARGERPRHDLHGRRRHARPPHGLHGGRRGIPPGHRRGHGRHRAGRGSKGQARAHGSPEDVGPAQAAGDPVGLLGGAVPPEVRGQGDVIRQP